MPRAKKKYHVFKLDLSVDAVAYIRKLANRCNLTESKVANVLLVMQLMRMEAQEKLDKVSVKRRKK